MKINIVSLMLLSAFAHSAVLAVLEIVPTSEVEELTISETRLLSDELRRQAVNLLPAKEFTVLTRDGIIALIPPDEKEAECLAESCAVDIGRAIGAEYISTGQIAKFSGELSLTVELYETMGGRLLGSFLTYGTNLTGLMETIKAESPAMFEKMKAHYFAGKENLVKVVSDDLEKVRSVETGIKSEGSSGLPKWVAVGLDVLGAGAIGFGIYQNSQAASHKKDYKNIPFGSPQGDFDSAYEKVESSRNMRNAGYIAGGVLLLGGVSVHIFF
jgi:Cu/Zn superoxide dismutase